MSKPALLTDPLVHFSPGVHVSSGSYVVGASVKLPAGEVPEHSWIPTSAAVFRLYSLSLKCFH